MCSSDLAPGVPAAPDPAAQLVQLGDAEAVGVEDDDAVRRTIARMLRGLGYAVVDASGPNAARTLTDEVLASVDLLVSDVVMPGMSGPRLVELLGDRRPGLRALMLSGFAREEVLKVGAHFAFLAKPFTRPELAAAVRLVLDAN